MVKRKIFLLIFLISINVIYGKKILVVATDDRVELPQTDKFATKLNKKLTTQITTAARPEKTIIDYEENYEDYKATYDHIIRSTIKPTRKRHVYEVQIKLTTKGEAIPETFKFRGTIGSANDENLNFWIDQTIWDINVFTDGGNFLPRLYMEPSLDIDGFSLKFPINVYALAESVKQIPQLRKKELIYEENVDGFNKVPYYRISGHIVQVGSGTKVKKVIIYIDKGTDYCDCAVIDYLDSRSDQDKVLGRIKKDIQKWMEDLVSNKEKCEYEENCE
jgi:hypothetical protein